MIVPFKVVTVSRFNFNHGAVMKYNIFEGFDWTNQRPIFQVKGVDNDYCGEWHITKPEAQKELDGLNRDCTL